MQLQQLTAIVLLFLQVTFVYCNELARGFNDDINWLNLEEGIKAGKNQNKPIMVLIHKSWCGACKALKPKFATDKDVEQLSERFSMVNIMDDEEPKDKKYSPDGGYIPRILFLQPTGEVQTEIINEGGNANYKYYYHDTKSIYRSMKVALGEEVSDDKTEL